MSNAVPSAIQQPAGGLCAPSFLLGFCSCSKASGVCVWACETRCVHALPLHFAAASQESLNICLPPLSGKK